MGDVLGQGYKIKKKNKIKTVNEKGQGLTYYLIGWEAETLKQKHSSCASLPSVLRERLTDPGSWEIFFLLCFLYIKWKSRRGESKRAREKNNFLYRPLLPRFSERDGNARWECRKSQDCKAKPRLWTALSRIVWLTVVTLWAKGMTRFAKLNKDVYLLFGEWN